MAALIDAPAIAFWYIQFVTKFPDADRNHGTFPWHQDNGYAALHPETNVTVWTALDDVDEQNGCVWVILGSHRRGLLPHKKQSADNWFRDVDPGEEGVPVPLRAGEAVAFSGLTLHRSLSNRSAHPRRGFFMGYADAATVSDDGTPIIQRPDSWIVAGELAPPSDKRPARIVEAAE